MQTYGPSASPQHNQLQHTFYTWCHPIRVMKFQRNRLTVDFYLKLIYYCQYCSADRHRRVEQPLNIISVGLRTGLRSINIILCLFYVKMCLNARSVAVKCETSMTSNQVWLVCSTAPVPPTPPARLGVHARFNGSNTNQWMAESSEGQVSVTQLLVGLLKYYSRFVIWYPEKSVSLDEARTHKQQVEKSNSCAGSPSIDCCWPLNWSSSVLCWDI